MHVHASRRVLIGSLVAFCCFSALPLLACSVPVFRYALEQWASDSYQVVVFHRGTLSDEDQAAVEKIRTAGDTVTNVALRTVDLDSKPDEAMLKLWESQKTETLPWMMVGYPKAGMPAVWSGRLSLKKADQLLDSPIRREIARRVLTGHTGVWVLLESGNKKEDTKAFKLLEKRIAHEQATLKLPEIAEEDIKSGLVNIDPDKLKIEFSALRLSRDDPYEALFIEMLLGTEADLRSFKKPMAFPVFGRGRVLYALVGDGINNEMVHEACLALTGPCTCEVKDQNPGTDLVMSVDWEQLVERTIDIDTELPPLQGLGSLVSSSAEEMDSLPGSGIGNGLDISSTSAVKKIPVLAIPSEPITQHASAIVRNTLILIGVCVAGVIGISLLIMVRGKTEEKQ